MPDISTILILTAPGSPNLQGYFIHPLVEEWESRGIKVTICDDLKYAKPADVCFVHVDLSVVPSEYIEMAGQCPYSINRHINDIRRRVYSRNLVRHGDGFDGPVIVKSSLNFAGVPERGGRVSRLREIWGKCHRTFTNVASPRIPFQQPSIEFKHHYRVFDERRMLPAGWLDRDDIVVERFRPERSGDLYVLREWYFLGDKEFFKCDVSEIPIFTTGKACPELVSPPPEAIRQIRRELRIDYGKIDYAIDRDGIPVLFDVNKTIGLPHPYSERARSVGANLADGLISLVTPSASGAAA